ncbi:N-acetyltransferase family protein [Fontivita pretiosa]|uniref:GNAT family N-acetyltransferase n=1 Tax=Fontivita pretiosa TaxID=2989684 RepID=UPI003D16BCE8
MTHANDKFTESRLSLRRPTPDDAPQLGRILYEAFKTFHERHHFEPDIPSLEMGVQLMQMFIAHERIWGVAAEVDAKPIGSNFLDERDPIRGVGPITVDPAAQARGVGRKLMQAVIDRGQSAGAAGIRLVQDAFNTASMSLYTSLGFDPKEPLALVRGHCRSNPDADAEVNPMTEDDLPACGELHRQVHGFTRNGALGDDLRQLGSVVLKRNGRVVAYSSAPSFWIANHGVAETERDMRQLLLGASRVSQQPLWMLLPIRRAEVFRWALSEGLRVMKPMTLMAMGQYNEPHGSFFPSVLY